MMALTKEYLELEIKKANEAIKSLDDGLAIHKIMLKAFSEELLKLE